MPIAQSSRPPLRQALALGLAAVLGVLAVLFLVSQMDRLVGGASIDLDIGDGIYRPGEAASLAEAIGGGTPLLVSDLAGGDRDIVISFTGDPESESDDADFWHVFAARQATAPRDCFVEWQPDDRTFLDACSGESYPEDGRGLPQYPVAVDGDGELKVDLNVSPVATDP